jgi:stringent starvation protein B
MSEASTKPYLIRAIHEWCSDNGFTPYLAVAVDQTTQVPREYVRAGEIVLNVSLEATNKLQLGNEFVEFQARFGGHARDIMIPIANVSAIYARENGHGMSFEVAKPLGIVEDNAPPGLSSVKRSSAPKSVGEESDRSFSNQEPKRPSSRKLKSVSTGDPASQDTAKHPLPDVPVETSGAVQDKAKADSTEVGDRVAPSLVPERALESPGQGRTSSGPRAVVQPRKKVERQDETISDTASTPEPDPSKPTGGKPKLTRVK